MTILELVFSLQRVKN